MYTYAFGDRYRVVDLCASLLTRGDNCWQSKGGGW